MIRFIIITCISLLMSACSEATTQEWTTDYPSPITPKAYQALLGRGLDVDWWERNKTDVYGNYTDKSVENFKQKGVGHIRIRLHHYNLTSNDFQRLKQQINTCLKQGVIPIVAFSAKPYKENPSEEEHKLVVDWWRKMAEEMSDYEDKLSFDLIIEPSDQLKHEPDELNSLYEDCVSAIRETNPTRIIFIASRKLSHPDTLCDLIIPTQGNNYLMAEWHFYAAGPEKDNPKKQWTTGTDYEKALITNQIEMAMNWQEQTGIYTWVGAWMPGNYNHGNSYSIDEQMAFAQFMCQELSKRKIPFAINTDKFFYNYATDSWVETYLPLMDVIFGGYK